MVINIGALKSGQNELVESDIKAVVDASGDKKVIIETCLLSYDEKVQACQLAKLAGADFVKTSTGFSTGGATIEDVELMREVVGPNMGVKAAGGTRSYKDAQAFIKAGANRIGTSAGVAMVDTEISQIIEEAEEAAGNAYVPYSHFRVGAALLTNDGQMYKGCNIENASFGLTNCAERTAIFKAVSEGHRDFEMIVVYGDTEQPISPCGACRQVMAEFFKQDSKVILIAEDKSTVVMTVGELLPYSFTDLQ